MCNATLASPLTCFRVSSATELSTIPIGAPLTASSSASFWAANPRSLRYNGSRIRISAPMSSSTTACRGATFSSMRVGISIAITLTGHSTAITLTSSLEPIYAATKHSLPSILPELHCLVALKVTVQWPAQRTAEGCARVI
jgi:hypothetical protein